MANRFSRFKKLREEAQSIWDESALRSQAPLSRLEKFAHFWVLVWKSFTRNRCPVRASALAYASLLALIPMLAVAMSITSSFLKKEGEERIDQFIVHLVANVTPPAFLGTNAIETTTNETSEAISPTATETNEAIGLFETNAPSIAQTGNSKGRAASETNGLPSFAREAQAVRARKAIARNINEFIQNTRSGALGVT